MRLAVGDRATVATGIEDPVELINHRHVLIIAEERREDGSWYLVGHPASPRRYGPYPAARLTPGWTVQ